MNLDNLLNFIFFIVGLAIGLLQLYIAQHQFEVQQREKMDELRKNLTEILQRLAVIEEMTSDRVFAVQNKLIDQLTGTQAVAEFTGEAGKQIRSLIDTELKASGIHDSMQRTNDLEQKISQILERSASTLVEQTTEATSTELSIRESQVLGLICQGYANQEIAETLGISVVTAGVYVTRLLQKFGVANRTQLVLKYRGTQQRSDLPSSAPVS